MTSIPSGQMKKKANKRFSRLGFFQLGAYTAVFPAALHLMLFFLVPLLILFRYSFYRYISGQALQNVFTVENYVRFISDPFFLRILLDTLGMGMIVAAVSLLIGYPLAYGMARANPRLKKIYYIIILMPLLTSAVTRTYGWMVLLSRQGLLSKLLQSIGLIDKPLDILYSFTAVIIGAIGIFLPFMILSLSGIIENILHSNVCDASKSLGAGPVRTFFSVVFPLSLPGIAAGTILAFVLSMATFVIPSLLGGASVKVIATQIFQEGVFLLNWPFAAVMAFILLITAGSIITIYYKLMTRKHAAWGRAE